MAITASRPADSCLNQIALEYSYAELQQATRNFDAASRLGHGSFGGVFRGIQKDGTEVAIKVLDVPEEGGFEEEVRVLSMFRHPNLVCLMGFARCDTKRFLVYELLAGGDVHRRLQKCCLENVPFTWRQRVSAAFDAACGLSHLHHSSPKVFHRDIKSPNILLDRNGTAKMADFGLACISKMAEHKVKQASGTVGYACPLYVQRGVVTEGSEIYSFGIVLLELLTASPPAYASSAAPDGSPQYQFLVSHIAGDIRKAVEMADSKAGWQPQVCHAIADLALRCTQIAEEMRPSFTGVVNTLRTLRDTPEAKGASPLSTPLGSPGHSGGCGQLPRPESTMIHAPPQQQQWQQQQQQQLQQQLQQQQQQQMAVGARGVMTPAAPLMGSPMGSPATPLGGAVMAPHQLGGNGGALNASVSAPGKPRTVAARQVLQPVLWTLECVQSEGASLGQIPRDQRSLTHRQELGGPLLATLRVGRLFQEDFFNALVADEEIRCAVSREHFQIWADEVQLPRTSASPQGGVPCAFFLTNYSVNGTIVNGQHLHARGEQVSLHAGDTIALARMVTSPAGGQSAMAPFLEFRFDLAGSVLADADVPFADVSAAVRPPVPPSRSTPATSSLSSPMPSSDLNLAACADSRRGGTCFVEECAEPWFALEVGGTAVRDGVAAESRRIVHGPPTGQDACPALLLGRAQQIVFWQHILIEDAFQALSRQHLQIEVEPHPASGRPTFYVRNLSDRSPIRVVGGFVEDAAESAPPLPTDQTHPLHSGDKIVVNASRGMTLWLVFRDLCVRSWAPGRTVASLAAVAGGAPARESAVELPARLDALAFRRPSDRATGHTLAAKGADAGANGTAVPPRVG